jgi:hypothetical protein
VTIEVRICRGGEWGKVSVSHFVVDPYSGCGFIRYPRGGYWLDDFWLLPVAAWRVVS